MKRWHLWTACCPQVLPFKLTFPHQKNTCTQSIKSEGSCTDAYVFFFFPCCCCFVIHKLYSCVGHPPKHRRCQCVWSKFTLTRITVTLVFLPLLLPLNPTHGLWGIRTQKQITCTFMTTVYICMRHAFFSLLLKGVFDGFALKRWFN